MERAAFLAIKFVTERSSRCRARKSRRESLSRRSISYARQRRKIIAQNEYSIKEPCEEGFDIDFVMASERGVMKCDDSRQLVLFTGQNIAPKGFQRH